MYLRPVHHFLVVVASIVLTRYIYHMATDSGTAVDNYD